MISSTWTSKQLERPKYANEWAFTPLALHSTGIDDTMTVLHACLVLIGYGTIYVWW